MYDLRPSAARIAVALFAVALAAAAPSPARADGELRLLAYSDVGYRIESEPHGELRHFFSMPNIDLFAAGSYERWSLVTEILFEHEMDSNELDVDFERAVVQYRATNWLRLSAGRFHTALGYYNDVYHHGTYLMLTSARPAVVVFEDHGGILPTHIVGVHADARIPVADLGHVRIDTEVGNGRGRTPTEVSVAFDPANQTAFNVRLRIEPAFDYVALGANLVLDHVPASAGGLATPMKERVLGAHLAILVDPVHLIAEAYQVLHTEEGTGAEYRSNGAFLELGYRLGDWQPFLRVDRIYRGADPYYLLVEEMPLRDGSSVLAGVKWTVNEHIALRAEGSATRVDGTGDEVWGGLLQLAYQF